MANVTCMCNYLQPAEPARPSSFEYDDDFPSVSESFLAEMFKGKSEEDKENGWCAVFCLFVCLFVCLCCLCSLFLGFHPLT